MHTVGESEMSSTGLNCTNSVEIPVDNFNSEAEPSCSVLMDEPEGSNLKQGNQVDTQSDLPDNTAHFSLWSLVCLNLKLFNSNLTIHCPISMILYNFTNFTQISRTIL